MGIEFIGLPGAGKSYLCTRLSETMQRMPSQVPFAVYPPVDSEARAKVLLRKLLRASLFVIRHPASAVRFLSLMSKSRQDSLPVGITKTLNLFSEIGRKEWSGGKIPACEQGVLQAIWSIALEARTPDIGGLVRAASPYLPHLVVHVETDPGELLRRLEGRTSGRSRLDRMPHARREEALRDGETLFAKIVADWMRQRPDHCYLRIRNADAGDIDGLVDRILASAV